MRLRPQNQRYRHIKERESRWQCHLGEGMETGSDLQGYSSQSSTKAEKAQRRASAMEGITQPNAATQVWPWDLERENNSPSCPFTSTGKKCVCERNREEEGERGL